MTKLFNKNIIVIGASKGFGNKVCHHLWAQGANILAVARSEDLLIDLTKHLRYKKNADGQEIFFSLIDLSDNNCSANILKKSKECFTQVDGIIFNAAIQGPIGLSWQSNAEEWQHTIQINLLSPVEITRIFIPELIKTTRASLVYLSGGGATGPRPRFSAYSVAKTGLVRFVENLASELQGSSIDANAISPGAMPTDMLRQVISAGLDIAGTNEYHAAKKTFDQGEVGIDRACDLVSFLISNKSQGITGRLISAQWDNWENWPNHLDELSRSDLYTLRRIVGSDRGKNWGDK